jgi:ATP adenylyltransferase/5',5'''-P-1,P-4-tetraphosphate phosphorylase II
MATDIDKFVHDQLSVWPAVAAKYRNLKSTRTRTLPLGGILVTLQSNPGRVPIFDHGCPLCEENYMEHQHTLPFEGRKGRKYNILVNRAPIFPNHLVITRDIHAPQTIWHRFPDMLDLAAALEGYIVFYNSPNSGTTVPQHAHFQACPKGYMPLERAAERLLRAAKAGHVSEETEFLASVRDAELYHYKRFNRGIFLLRAQTAKSMAKLFYRLLDCMNLVAEETEPRFNAFTYCCEGEYRTIVTLRGDSHPQCYFAEGDAHFSILPGAADMAGFVVVPREEDFDRLDTAVLQQIFADVTLPAAQEERLLWRLVRTQPRMEVEIESGMEISFEIISDGAGPQKVRFQDGRIDYNGVLYDELVFEAVTISTLFAEPSFLIYNEGTRRYAGTLKFLVKDGKVQAVNILGMEDYLLSVVSLMPTQEQKEKALALRKALFKGEKISDPYIGLTEKADSAARAAIDETWGQIL